jgi:hypothetical protein
VRCTLITGFNSSVFYKYCGALHLNAALMQWPSTAADRQYFGALHLNAALTFWPFTVRRIVKYSGDLHLGQLLKIT